MLVLNAPKALNLLSSSPPPTTTPLSPDSCEERALLKLNIGPTQDFWTMWIEFLQQVMYLTRIHYYKIYFPDFWTTTSQLYQGEVFSLRVSPWQEGGGGDW